MKKTISIYFLSVFWGCFLLASQVVFAVNYKFRHYTVESGLSSNTVRSIIQDRAGYIWVATDEGLNRMAGSVIETFRHDPSDPYSMRNNEVWSICEDSLGDIWVGGKGCVHLYDVATGYFRLFKDGGLFRPNDIFYSIVEDQGGNIWMCARGNGLFRYNRRADTLINYSQDKVSQSVSNILVDHSGRLWCVPKEGQHIFLYHSETDDFEKIRLYDPLVGKIFGETLTICEDSQGNIWLGGTNSTLMKMDTERRISTMISPENTEYKGRRIRSMLEYKPGILLLETSNGILVYDYVKHAFSKIDSDRGDVYGLNDVFIHALLKDREGGLWGGTFFGGLNYLSPVSLGFEYYQEAPVDGVSEHFIVSRLCEDSKGNIWIGSDNGGMGKFVPETGAFSHVVIDKNKPALNIHALYADETSLWVGTYLNGVYRKNFSTGKVKHYSSPGSLTALYRDMYGELWAGGSNGAFIYDDKEERFVKVVGTGENCNVMDIVDDGNGTVWLASNGSGLFAWNSMTKEAVCYSNKEGQPGYVTNRMGALCFYQKRLWVGTSGRGLWYFDAADKCLKREFVNKELDLISIYCIIPHDSHLWMTTSKGLARYNTENGKVVWYNEEDGLQGRVFNPNAGLKSSSGKIYLGGGAGFNAFDPNRIVENNYAPNIVFTGFKVAGKEVAVDSSGILQKHIDKQRAVCLKASQNAFTVDFTALSYTAPSKMDYRYRLKGFEREWTELRDRKAVSVSYTNLSYGEYVFEVMAGRNAGDWITPVTELAVIILPPWWKTIWMQLVYLLLLLGSIAGVCMLGWKKVKRKQIIRLQEMQQKNAQELLKSKIRIFQEIAHEIRTPVTLIAAPVEEILMASDVPEHIREDLEIVRNNSGHLVDLMNEVLDFSQVETKYAQTVRRQVDVGSVLGNIIDRFRSAARGKDIAIDLYIPQGQPLIGCLDTEAFDKIVSNLMSNALKFTRDHIEVTLTGGDSSHFGLTIRDNGVGVENEQDIFELFYHSSQENRREFKGFGIGLAVVSLLVKKMGASIRVESEENEFAAFHLQFPLGSERMQEGLAEAIGGDVEMQMSPEDIGEQERAVVLVVEDNDELRQFLAKSLGKDYQVKMAANGEEALAVLEQTVVDIVVSDVVMPVMDGWELCRQMKDNVAISHIPVVMLTARTDVDSKITALENGADVYIEKPVVMKYLYAQIVSILDKRRQLQELFSQASSASLSTIVKNTKEEAFVVRLNQIVEENISNSEFSMDEIAGELCMSRSAMYAKIKAISGLTPNNFVRVVRLRKAAELLRSGNDYKINEVCYLVGFSSPSYFAKCFQQQFGVLPGDFVSSKK